MSLISYTSDPGVSPSTDFPVSVDGPSLAELTDAGSASLTPDALMAYCQAHLDSIDGQVQGTFNEQEVRNGEASALQRVIATFQTYSAGVNSGDSQGASKCTTMEVSLSNLIQQIKLKAGKSLADGYFSAGQKDDEANAKACEAAATDAKSAADNAHDTLRRRKRLHQVRARLLPGVRHDARADAHRRRAKGLARARVPGDVRDVRDDVGVPREGEEQIAQAVEIHDELPPRRRVVDGEDVSLGAPADGARQMQSRCLGRACRQDEGLEGGARRVRLVDRTFYTLDLDVAEIAATLRIGPGAVRSTMSRGLAALARVLEEE